MRLGEVFRNGGPAAVVLGLGAGLAVIVGSCTGSLERGTEPGASEARQAAVQVQVPSLDLDEPVESQTASFAFG